MTNVESSLLKNIKYRILSKWLNGDNEAINIGNILPMVAALVYPFRNNIAICSEADIIQMRGTLNDILDNVKRFSKSKGDRLDSYSYEALVECFRKEWFDLLTFDQKRRLCRGISIITSVEDSGYVVIKGNETVWGKIVSNGYDELPAIYGRSEYKPIEINEKTVKQVREEKARSPRQHVIISSDTDRAINDFWLNNIVTESYRSCMPYVWKLRISQDNYQKLKSKLKSVCEAYGSKKQRLLEQHAEKLLAYVAEWYRREYTAREGNAIKEISRYISAKEIFDSCPRWNDFVYSGESNDCWLYSMYVLGGLPIKYSSYTLSVLYDKIFDAINGNPEALDSVQNFNNAAFKESLENSNGSLRLFVESIVNGDLPFCEEDLELDEVKTFIERIKEGHKRSRLKKYRLEWIVNYDGLSEYGDRRLRILFNPELPGELHGSISYSRMTKSWNIPNAEDIPSFKILCRINDNEPFAIINYSNQWNGFFVGWATEDYVDIPRSKVPVTYINKIDIILSYQANDKEFSQVIQTEEYKVPYIQFYPTDEICEWSSLVRYGNLSAVAFRMPLHSDMSSELQFSDNSDDADRYGWKTFVDKCLLEDIDDKTYSLRRKGDSIEISPRLKKQTICYNQGLVKYVKRSETTNIPLILGIDGVEIKRYEIDKDEPIILKREDYQLEYKTPDSTRYTEWTNPPQGFITIRVTSNEQTSKLDAYYLPSTYTDAIKRSIPNHEIRFDQSIRNIYNDNIGVLNSCFRDIDYSDRTDSSDPFNKYVDEIIFRIGDSNEYIELPVYRPYIRKVLSFNGKPIFVSENKDKVFSVAMVNSDRMSVHVIDEHGKKTYPKQNVGFCDFEEEISWINDNTNMVINNDSIKYNICDDNSNSGLDKGRIRVSREFKDEYKFFFWPVNKWSEPIEIDTEYDSSCETLVINSKYLAETGIIFQSLNELNPPRYWKPVITRANKYAEFTYDIKTQIMCLDIAIKHGVYFKIFRPLYKIVPDTGGLQDSCIVEFFFEYAKSKNNNLSDIEWHGLYRFADEFMFDWLFLARSEWMRYTSKNRDNRKLVTELFRKNPKIKNKSIIEQAAYANIVETYWSNNYPSREDSKWQPRGHKLETKAIKFMNSFLDKYEFTGNNRDYQTIKSFLHDLYEKDNSFQLIFSKIKDELFN